MKITILRAALGIVTSVAPAYGQGSIFFNNYGANTDAIVTWGPGEPDGSGPVTTPFKASLFYSFGGGPLTPLGNETAFNPATPGYFQGPIVTIPGYSGGSITFQLIAYTGSYFNPAFVGQSAPFTLPSIATGTQPVGEFGPSLKPFSVHYVPEPATIALFGLGLMSLLIFPSPKIMKKTILAAALGIVASVAPSYGQGSIFFNNYGATTDAKVTIYDPGYPLDGQPAANGFKATLFYQFGGGALTALGNVTAFNPAIPGYFTGPIVTIPGYAGGPISFQIFAYDGADPFSSVYQGRSSLFTLDSIATGTQPVGEFGPAFQPFQVSCACPELGTVVLVGLGLVSLLIFRPRKL